MNKMARVLSDIDAAISAINEELALHDKGCPTVDIPRSNLESFLDNLEAMKAEVSNDKVSGYIQGMRRIIVDCWPFSTSLGAAIGKAEDSYMSVSPR